MQARERRSLRSLHLVLDGLVVAAAMVLAFWAHGLLRDVVSFLKHPPAPGEYVALAVTVLPLWLALVVVFGMHRSFERIWGRLELAVDLVKVHLVGLVGISVVLFLTQSVINRSLVALFLGGSFVLMYLTRALLGWRLQALHRRGHGQSRVLLVGEAGEEMARFVREAARDPLAPALVGRVGEGEGEGICGGGKWIGNVEEIGTILEREGVDLAVFFAPYERPESVPEALAACEELGVEASFSVEMVKLARAAPRISFLYDRPFIAFDVAPKAPAALAVKHGVDAVAAALGLLVLAPLLALIAASILVTMGRPIFFSQERAGRFGRRFRMLKFRTMVKDAEARRSALAEENEMNGPVFKVTRDPRITRLGRLLRKTSLDELPQLLNVLAGHMSLVGPRPLPLSEQEAIRGYHRRRLSMRPGITGLWQVSGRSDVDFDEWMALDLRYVDEWSPGLDLLILLKTIPTVLLGRGAR